MFSNRMFLAKEHKSIGQGVRVTVATCFVVVVARSLGCCSSILTGPLGFFRDMAVLTGVYGVKA